MFRFSVNPTVEKLRVEQKEFIYQKMNWGPWQTPRNLFLALVGELGELSDDVASNEQYTIHANENSDKVKSGQLETATDSVEKVLSELADVFSYLICLAQECQVNIAIPDSQRKDEPTSSFSEISWNEIEVTAFYQTVRISEKTGIIRDFLSICFSASRVADHFQWIIIEKGLKNLPKNKQEIIDKYIKELFCQVVIFASKYEYDLPKFLKEKNTLIAEKYCLSVGKLTKDDVITCRYSHLPSFHLTMSGNHSTKNDESYQLDKSVKNLKLSIDQLLCKLMKSVGLVAESFQWKTDGAEAVITKSMHAHMCNQLSTITNLIQTLAQLHNISLAESFNKKMNKNRDKYPLSDSKGTFIKYNEKEEVNMKNDDSHLNYKYPSVNTLADATTAMQLFVDERDWNKYHKNPRNLTIALFGEIGEVIELFVEKRKSDFTDCLGDELSDCLAYTVRLVKCCDIDLSAAMVHYFP